MRVAAATLDEAHVDDVVPFRVRRLHLLQKLGILPRFLEQRPSHKKKWDYVFFIDIEGHADDQHVAKALVELKKRASLFRILGSYPRAVQ